MHIRKMIDVSVAAVWGALVVLTGVKTVQSVPVANFFQNNLVRYLWNRELFLDLNGGWTRLLGQRQCKDVIRLNNGHLSRPSEKLDSVASAALMDVFSRYCETLGIKTLFVQCPYKVDFGQSVVPYGAPFDWANWNADAFRANLHTTEELDLRPVLGDSVENVSRNFFRTDHHWTFLAAFAASREIARRVLALVGAPDVEAGTLDEDKWEKHIAQRHFLGSFGRRTGPWFGGDDEIEFLIPSFQTDYLWSSSLKNGIVQSGSFDKTVLRSENLAQPRSHYHDFGYSLYGYDQGMIRFENRLAPVKRRIVVVKDSYGDPVVAFLSTVFSEVVAFDLRHWKDMAMTNVVSILRPDAVLVLYSPRDLSPDPFFAFNGKDEGSDIPERVVLLERDCIDLEGAGHGADEVSLGEGLFRPGDGLCLTIESATASDRTGAWASVSLVDVKTGKVMRRDGVACGVSTPQRLLFFVPNQNGDFRLILQPRNNERQSKGCIELRNVLLECVSR